MQLTANSKIFISTIRAISVAIAMPYIRYASAVGALEVRVITFLGVWNVHRGMSDGADRDDSRANELQQDARAPRCVQKAPTFAADLHDRERDCVLFIVCYVQIVCYNTLEKTPVFWSEINLRTWFRSARSSTTRLFSNDFRKQVFAARLSLIQLAKSDRLR